MVSDTGKALTSRLEKEYSELQKVIVESGKGVVVAKGCRGVKNCMSEFLYFLGYFDQNFLIEFFKFHVCKIDE